MAIKLYFIATLILLEFYFLLISLKFKKEEIEYAKNLINRNFKSIKNKDLDKDLSRCQRFKKSTGPLSNKKRLYLASRDLWY